MQSADFLPVFEPPVSVLAAPCGAWFALDDDALKVASADGCCLDFDHPGWGGVSFDQEIDQLLIADDGSCLLIQHGDVVELRGTSSPWRFLLPRPSPQARGLALARRGRTYEVLFADDRQTLSVRVDSVVSTMPRTDPRRGVTAAAAQRPGFALVASQRLISPALRGHGMGAGRKTSWMGVDSSTGSIRGTSARLTVLFGRGADGQQILQLLRDGPAGADLTSFRSDHALRSVGVARVRNGSPRWILGETDDDLLVWDADAVFAATARSLSPV